MPDIGVELRLLRVGAALDLDAAEPRVPVVGGLAHDAVEIPVRQLGAQIGARAFDAGVGNRRLHQQRCCGFTEIHDRLAVLPVPDRREGFFEFRDEEHLEGLRAAQRRTHREAAHHRRVAVGRLDGNIEHVAFHQRPRAIDDHAGGLTLRVGVTMETDARGGRQLGGDAVGLEQDLVIAGADDLAVVGELRGVFRRIGFPGDGHHCQACELPAVDVAEALDGVVLVAVAGVPVALRLRVRAEVDHAERAAGGVEVEPARLDRVDLRAHPIDGSGFRRCGQREQGC